MSTTGTNRFLDEFAKLMTDAAGAAQGMRKEAEAALHAQADRWLNSLDVVKREEFDAVREMAIKARDENDALRARIEALEAKLAFCCQGLILFALFHQEVPDRLRFRDFLFAGHATRNYSLSIRTCLHR